MQRTDLAKALSITLLLSCATHVHAMKRNRNKELMQQKQQQKNAAPQAAAATDEKKQAGLNIGDSQEWPDLNQKPATTPEPKDESSEETKQEETAAQEVSTAVATLMVAAKSEEASASKASEVVASMEKIAKDKAVAEPAQAKKTLLGKEIATLYNMDERPLVGKSLIWTIDATQPYKDEAKLIAGLKKKDKAYLQDVQAQQDLNRTLNQICAGIIQKIKEQSTLDKGTGLRSFTTEQIETILGTQEPRAMNMKEILSLCDAQIKAKEGKLHPQESVKELAQTCFTALSQLQLERKLRRSEEENNRIREIKEAQRLAFSMRLEGDKGSISEDEYSNLFIFDKTTDEN